MSAIRSISFDAPAGQEFTVGAPDVNGNVAVTLTGVPPTPAPPIPTPSPAVLPTPTALGTAWDLEFSEEFAATSLDPSVWLVEDGYTNKNGCTTHAANVSIVNGVLNLAVPVKASGAEIVTNAAVFAKGQVIEARFLVPGSGQTIYNWPAPIWTSGPNWPVDGEIDIFEGLGGGTCNYHYGTKPGVQSPADNSKNPAITGTFGGVWMTATAYRKPDGTVPVYWNQQLVRTITTHDSGNPHQVILTAGQGNTAKLGAAGTVLVDYVRIWSPA